MGSIQNDAYVYCNLLLSASKHS